MPVNDFENLVQNIYDEGRIDEEEGRSLINQYNAANASKKVPELLDSLLFKTMMLDDLYNIMDEGPREEIDEIIDELRSYEWVDWEEGEINDEEIESYFFDQAHSGVDVTDEGEDILQELDRLYDDIIDTWNITVDYIEDNFEASEDVTELPDSRSNRGVSPEDTPDPDEPDQTDDSMITILGPEGLLEKIGSRVLGEDLEPGDN